MLLGRFTCSCLKRISKTSKATFPYQFQLSTCHGSSAEPIYKILLVFTVGEHKTLPCLLVVTHMRQTVQTHTEINVKN